MKTKMLAIILGSIILLSESSCFLRIGGRRHGAAVGVGVVKPHVEKDQQMATAVPIDHLKNIDTIALAEH
jgi:hypothetical protein